MSINDSSLEQLWADLATTALLGTERRALALPAPAEPLGRALAQIDQADQPGALLSAAALLAAYHQAARAPALAKASAAEPCAPEESQPCPPAALQHLWAIVNGTQRALLPEWLAALSARGRHVPPALLPDLLELGRSQPELRGAIVPALGKRGVWLAAQNSDWAFARGIGMRLGESETQDARAHALWDTGGRGARAALLLEARESAPERARELLQRTWASDKADERVALLGTFELGLSMGDEPLLEALLDDRSKEVRRSAAGLLARLPESRLVGRMRERAAAMLSWAPPTKGRIFKSGRGARLEYHPPAQFDPAWGRDAVEARPPAHLEKLGERAWWLLQIISCVPPSDWSGGWAAAPAELAEAARQGDWGAALLAGWRAATANHRDAGWAEALLRHDQHASELLAVLAPARQETLLLEILRGDCAPMHKHPVLELLRKTSHAWSAELTRAVLRALYRHMRGWRDTYDYQLRGALTEEFARRMPPALLHEIGGGWPDEPEVRERWQGVLDKLMITLQFRRDMLAALGSGPAGSL